MKFEFKSLSINGDNLVKLSVGDYILWQSGNVILTLSDGTKEYHQYSDGVVPSGAFANRTDIVAAEFKSSITKLDVGVFQYDSNLTSVTLTDNITSIGTACFWACGKLKSITIPKGMTSIPQNCFTRCYGLTDIVIPNNITSIGKGAFTSCSNVTAITIPDSVTSIGANAFEGWKEKGTLNCSDDWYDNLSETSVTNLGNVYNWREKPNVILTLSDGTTSGVCYSDGIITNHAFYGKTNIVSAKILSSITSTGQYSFAYCSNLTSVTFESGVTTIGLKSFQTCTSLTSVTIPDSVTTVETYAFGDVPTEGDLYCSDDWYSGLSTTNITNLGNVYHWRRPEPLGAYDVRLTLEDGSISSVTYSNGIIPDRAFSGKTNIVKAEIGDGITTIGVNTFKACTNITSVTIPDTVTTIGDYCFCDCTSITSITIPSGLTTINQYAFGALKSIKTIEIPDSVTSIGKDAFLHCESVTSITIPDSVTSITSASFGWCVSLKTITIGSGVSSNFRSLLLWSFTENLSSFTIKSKNLIPDKYDKTDLSNVATTGTLTCYEDWYNANKSYLGNLATDGWTKVWL